MKRHPSQHPCTLAAAALFLLLVVLSGCAYLAREATRVYMTVNAQFSDKDIEFQINKSFIEKYKDRVGITTTFTVDQAMQNPVARIFDGDLHMAGRAPEIGLMAVAEIANGALAKKSVDLLVKRLRMVFAKDTPPEKAVRLLKRGARLHVYGLPRMDFAEVSRRVRGSRTDPTLLTKPLPYEIIIQGVYKDDK